MAGKVAGLYCGVKRHDIDQHDSATKMAADAAAASALMADATTASGPKVLVLGFGALGALYGFLLARGGARVYAVARSNAATLREHGINIQSQLYGHHAAFKPTGVLTSAEEARAEEPFDYVLCTVKIVPEHRPVGVWIRDFLVPLSSSSSLASASHSGGKGDGKKAVKTREDLPTIVFVENGIGIEEEPYETLCNGKDPVASAIISCCAWLGATLIDGGRTVSHGGLEKLEMGLYPAPIEPQEGTGDHGQDQDAWRRARLHAFHRTYTAGEGGGVLIEGDIQPKRWTKLLWNAAWGGLTALARQPVSVMLADENLEYTSDVVRKTMLEIMYVARACGYNEDVLPASAIDSVFNLTYSQAPSILPAGQVPNLTSDFKPSILVRFGANRILLVSNTHVDIAFALPKLSTFLSTRST